MELHGLLLVDKPTEMTSHDVVAVLRKRLRQKRIGHTGTLDPIATGLMVIVLGEATKLSDYLISEDKSYQVDIRLGIETDTLDRSGQVLRTGALPAEPDHVRRTVAEMAGEFDWPVPAFSAVKVKGQPLHQLARQNQPVEAPIKRMSFWNVQLRSCEGDRLTVDLDCSKGSFIRTWTQKLGERLGTGAVVEELRRRRVGPWSLERSLSLPQLEQLGAQDPKEYGEAFIPVNDSLPGYRTVSVDERDARLMLNGQIPRDVAARLIPEQKQAFESGESVFIKIINARGELLAILGAQPGQGLKIRRVFRFS